LGECQIAPDAAPAANPAFDVTPARNITAIITEKGVVYPPFEENLARLMK
jgi:methylthioribose-1-phosphate isomerase